MQAVPTADGVRPMPFNAPHSVLRSQLAR